MEEAGLQLIAQDASQFFGDMTKASRAVDAFSDTTNKAAGGVGAAGQVMIGMARKVGEVFVDLGIQAGKAFAGFVTDSINTAGDFEQTLNTLQATSGATAQEMDAIAQKAVELGADLSLPATSASSAGEAMLELSKAGFTVQEAMDAAKGTLQLAAAAQIDEAKAAEITANAINAFGLQASDAIFVSDLLAASANASSVEITDVAQSYQMAGAIFSNFQGPVVGSKQAIIDLTTAVGLLGNAGIKGSDAGTSLKQALLQLTGPSKKSKGLMKELAESIGVAGDIAYDAQGKMRSFPEILGLTAAATKNLTDEKRNQYITDIFGADASRAILILMQQGPDAWDKMTAAVTRQGAAQELAAAKMKGLKGTIAGIQSQVETFQLALGTVLAPVLDKLLNAYVVPLVANMADFGSKIAFATDPALALAGALHQWSAPLGSIAFYLVELVRGGEGVNAWLKATPPLFQGFVGGIQGAISTIQGVVGAVQGFIGTIQPTLTFFFGQIAGNTPTLLGFVGAVQGVAQAFGLTGQQAAGVVGAIQGIITKFQVVTSWLQEKIPLAITFVNQHWALFQGALTAVGGLMAGARVAGAIAMVAGLLGTLLTPIGLITAGAALLGAAWQTNFMGIQTTLTTFWTSTALPVLGQLATWLQTNIPIALQTAATFWTGTLQPALEQVWGVFTSQIIPIISNIAQTVLPILGSALQVAASFWTNILGPALQIAWSIFTNQVLPILQVVTTWLRDNLPPAIQVVADFLSNTLFPALNTVASFIGNNIIPLFAAVANVWLAAVKKATEVVAALWQNVLYPALSNVWKIISDKLNPILQAIGEKINQYAAPAIKDFTKFINDATGGIDGISGAIQDAIKWLSDLADTISNMELPSWLTPGSPTPLEIGLWGIADAMRTVAHLAGDELSDALDRMQHSLDFQAAIPRTLDSMDSFMADLRERLTAQPIDIISAVFGGQRADDLIAQVQGQLDQALGQSHLLESLDPQAAQQFLQLRTDQIQELADLQEQLLNASGPEAAALQQRIQRITEAQGFELQAFLSQIENIGSILPQLLASVRPPASASQVMNIPQTAGNQTTNNYNLGVTTNQSPAAAYQSFTAMQAMYGRGA